MVSLPSAAVNGTLQQVHVTTAIYLTIEKSSWNTRRVISSPQNKTIKIRFFFNKISRH